MRLDVVGDNLVERLGLLGGLVPTPLVQVSLGMGYARGITAGLRQTQTKRLMSVPQVLLTGVA